jgi:outer membrane lipase/esterase
MTIAKVRAAMLAAAICLAPTPVLAATFDNIFVFGDSTVDSGWWRGALAGDCGPVTSPCTTNPNNPTHPNKDDKIQAAIDKGGTGAPVGGVGLMNPQVLAQYYGLSAEPANQPNGTNYAISGSLSSAVGGSGNLNPNPNLPSTVGQINLYSNTHTADPNALYLISSGGNDITYAKDNFSGAAQQTFLTSQAAALASAIQSLQLAGADHILVLGTQGSGGVSQFWMNELFTDLANLSVDFIGADIAGLIADVEANPAAYGITPGFETPGVDGAGLLTTSACVAGAGATGWGQWCANTTLVDPDLKYSRLRSPNSEQESFWSDDQHLSAAGQKIEAEYEYGLLQQVEATPLPATLPLFATGLGGLTLLSWRRKSKQAN